MNKVSIEQVPHCQVIQCLGRAEFPFSPGFTSFRKSPAAVQGNSQGAAGEDNPSFSFHTHVLLGDPWDKPISPGILGTRTSGLHWGRAVTSGLSPQGDRKGCSKLQLLPESQNPKLKLSGLFCVQQELFSLCSPLAHSTPQGDLLFPISQKKPWIKEAWFHSQLLPQDQSLILHHLPKIRLHNSPLNTNI